MINRSVDDPILPYPSIDLSKTVFPQVKRKREREREREREKVNLCLSVSYCPIVAYMGGMQIPLGFAAGVLALADWPSDAAVVASFADDGTCFLFPAALQAKQKTK